MKKLFTAKDVESLLRSGQGPEAIPAGALLTPSAQDILKAKGRSYRPSSATSTPATPPEPMIPDYEYKWTPGQRPQNPR